MMSDPLPLSPPTRVIYSPWEPVYGPPQQKLVATDVRGALFPWVAEYTSIEDRPLVGWQRERLDIWETPATTRIASTPGTGDIDLVFTAEHVPAQRIARKEMEHRGV